MRHGKPRRSQNTGVTSMLDPPMLINIDVPPVLPGQHHWLSDVAGQRGITAPMSQRCGRRQGYTIALMMRMRRGWDDEAGNWVRFAREPGTDRAHEGMNLPALLDILPAPGRGTLDLACGEGRLGRLLRSLHHRVVGADASPSMVRFAAAHPAGAPVVLADATQLPFADEAFDLVVAYMCLHDIDDMPAAVQEAARVLEPAGRLCVAIPHPINTAGDFEGRGADAPFVISGSYLDAAPSEFVADRGDFRLTFHSEHRPLEAYMRAFEAADLLTETAREVKAPAQFVAQHPGTERWQRIPLFLHLRATKRS